MPNNHLKSKNLSEFLSEEMALKNLNSEKLAVLCDLPPRHVESLRKGDYKSLPAAPYVRGFLFKIAAVLSVSGEELWRMYKKEAEALKILEPVSPLPRNRFALRKIGRRGLLIVLAVALVLIYTAFRTNEFLGIPRLNLETPLDSLAVSEPVLAVKGSVSPRDSLIINGENVKLDGEGNFEQRIQLSPGLNSVEFKVKRFLGREVVVRKQILYQP